MTVAVEGGEWSAARPGWTLPPGKTRYPFYRRLGGLQGRSGRAENLVPTGIWFRTVQPIVSRCTDWATQHTHTHTHTHIYMCVCVCLLTMLLGAGLVKFLEWLRKMQGSITDRDKKMFSSRNCPYQLWGTPSWLLIPTYRKGKNEWSYTSAR